MTEQVNPTLETAEEAPKKKKTWLIILIIIAILLCCCVAIVIGTIMLGGPAVTEIWEQVQATLTAQPF